MTSERARELADDFAAANAEVVGFASSCTPEQWESVVPGEEWTVGVVVHHIAEGHALGLRWLKTMAAGEPVLDTADEIDSHNGEHAARSAGVGITETVTLLEDNGAHLESLLRALSDDELDRTAPFGPAGGQLFPVAQLAAVSARHARGHLEHARHAAGSSEPTA